MNAESLLRLEWDSQFFNRPVYQFDTLNHPVLDETELPKGCLVQSKVAAGEIAAMDALQAQGFSLVESECLFQKTLQSCQPALSDYENTKKIDALAVGDLAAEIFSHSRFRTPWFAADDASRLYRQWAINAIEQRFDDVCLIETADTLTAGFVTARMLDEKTAAIGLIGTNPSCQGKGIGTRLLRRIENWAIAQGAETLKVATQGSNTVALRWYAHQEYIFQNLFFWFYKQR